MAFELLHRVGLRDSTAHGRDGGRAQQMGEQDSGVVEVDERGGGVELQLGERELPT